MKLTSITLAALILFVILAGTIYVYYNNYLNSNNSINTTKLHLSVINQNLRIVSLAPSDTQILIALGLGRYIVGIDSYSYSLLQYLNMTNLLPKNVTVFSQIYPPNISGILLLHPTVVVVEYGLEAQYISQMKEAGLNLLITNSDYAYSFSQIEENIMQVANYFNLTTNGEELVNWMNNMLNTYSYSGNTSVAYLLYICPNLDFYTIGGNVFINSIIVQAGGINVFATQSGYPLLSPEELIVANPQVIIAQEVSNFSYTRSLISQYPGIDNISAYKDGRVYVLGQFATYLLNEPGPLSVYSVPLMHEIIEGNAPKFINSSWVKENLNVTLPIFS